MATYVVSDIHGEYDKFLFFFYIKQEVGICVAIGKRKKLIRNQIN